MDKDKKYALLRDLVDKIACYMVEDLWRAADQCELPVERVFNEFFAACKAHLPEGEWYRRRDELARDDFGDDDYENDEDDYDYYSDDFEDVIRLDYYEREDYYAGYKGEDDSGNSNEEPPDNILRFSDYY